MEGWFSAQFSLSAVMHGFFQTNNVVQPNRQWTFISLTSSGTRLTKLRIPPQLIPLKRDRRAVVIASYFCDSITNQIFIDEMLKLYKNIEGTLHYWETWAIDEKTGIIHWGVVGDKGQSEKINSSLLTNFRKKIQRFIDEKVAEGYDEIEEMAGIDLHPGRTFCIFH